MHNRIALALILTLLSCSPEGDSEPETAPATEATPDIFVGPITRSASGPGIGQLSNVTNRDGYDNQPSFSPDGGSVYYTVQSDGQTDIYRYDLESQETTRVTRTPESEYSATATPDGRHFTVIRVEADSLQRLWRFNLAGDAQGVVLSDVYPVGYHAWGNATTIGLFVLGDPPTFQLADASTGEVRVIEENIGRSIHKRPGKETITFTHRVSEDERWIKEIDLGTGAVTELVRTLPGSEDYAWLPDGTALMGSGSVLYRWTPGSAEWVEVADLASSGVEAITRLAVNGAGDRIAIVGQVAH